MAIFPCGFQQVYGLTETTGAITLLPPKGHDPTDARKLLSCGYAQEGVELRIVAAQLSATSARTGDSLPQIVDGAIRQRPTEQHPRRGRCLASQRQ